MEHGRRLTRNIITYGAEWDFRVWSKYEFSTRASSTVRCIRVTFTLPEPYDRFICSRNRALYAVFVKRGIRITNTLRRTRV